MCHELLFGKEIIESCFIDSWSTVHCWRIVLLSIHCHNTYMAIGVKVIPSRPTTLATLCVIVIEKQHCC